MDVKNDIGSPISTPGNPGGVAPPAPAREDHAPSPALKEAAKEAPEEGEVRKIVREALKINPLPERELRIEIASDVNMVVVKVVDKESGEVVRQIPFAETVASAKRIKERLDQMAREQRGLAVDREV
ncbi:MAG: flagellar protein FlaG [Deltaproteobacteria bacterium]|nr:flagellar protein FlaG [Deltaproteobacteria bacterium]